GGQPGRPPGAGGGQPPFGGGQPGFPGGGGTEVAGTIKHKVPPFYAGVFDPDQKELIIIGLKQSGTQQGGVITRFKYPDFKSEGAPIDIAHVATRAALDSKQGLLYVTTVTGSHPPLLRDQFDAGAYPGEIQVYDLAQLRASKGDEKGDFKPNGTNITVGPGK